MILSPKQAMLKALREAQKGLGWVAPNPPVGCVILDSDNNFLASGYHTKYGADHAEVSALKKIVDKKKLKNAQVFVTLEPCHHFDKTPPCSRALGQYPIKSLMYGAKDPNTGGKGLRYLKKRGIQLSQSPYYTTELEHLVAPFKFLVTHKKPFVSLKAAISLDGAMALRGESQWITSEKARRHTHIVRSEHSAVLIGANTFLKDNPRLDIRYGPFKGKQNKVIILDPGGKTLPFLPDSALLKARAPNKVIICVANALNKGAVDRVIKAGVRVRAFKQDKGKGVNFSLSALLGALYREEDIFSILVEGGAFCLSQFLRQGAGQRLYLYIAPKIIGGGGLSWSGDLHIERFSQILKVRPIQWKALGEDLLLTALFY